MNIMSVCSVSDYDTTNVFISENELRQHPQRKHITQTRALLNDFCISTVIPEFDTVSQLLRWRKYIIYNADCDNTLIMQTKRKPTGRKRKVTADDFKRHYERFINDEVTKKELTVELNICIVTLRSLINETIKGSQ